ncbi:MAG: WG repeat-containing protein [Candidatus Melainabacteria bacterium]|nr:MAG: WG repeat-containing protein [Candidatus Melainabacteria bacterium]
MPNITLSLVKLAVILSASQIVDESSDNPDVLRPYNDCLIEFCDSSLRPILPTKFSRVDYVGHGLFLGWSLNPEDKYQYGSARTLFTKEGKILDVHTPAGTKLVQVFWLGKAAEQNPNLEFAALPKEAIFRFITKDRTFGLCDANGDIVLPAEYGAIGQATNGKAFVADKGVFFTPIKTDSFYVFDCADRKLTKLPLTGIIRTEYFCRSEGLTAFDARTHQTRGGSALSHKEAESEKSGYIDDTGQFAIIGKFQKAGPFHNGMATVSLQNGQSVIIDKHGKIISPENLDIQDFYGDYAIARKIQTAPPQYGIVNRKFEFVVQPKYKCLIEQNSPYSPILSTCQDRYSKPVDFYFAYENSKTQPKLLKANGTVLLQLTTQVQFNCRQGEAIKCKNLQTGEDCYFNLNGEPIPNPAPESADELGRQITYHEIAPKRFLKSTSLHDGHFDPALWQGDHHRIVQRQNEWARFLREYDLIDMPRSKVIELLGTGVGYDPTTDRYTYVLAYHCTGGSFVVVQMKNDKVESWSLLDDGKQVSDWYKTNVVLESDTLNVLPKSK